MNQRPSAFAAPFATIAALCSVPLLALGCAKRFPIRQFDYSQYGTVAVLPFQTEGFLERNGRSRGRGRLLAGLGSVRALGLRAA